MPTSCQSPSNKNFSLTLCCACDTDAAHTWKLRGKEQNRSYIPSMLRCMGWINKSCNIYLYIHLSNYSWNYQPVYHIVNFFKTHSLVVSPRHTTPRHDESRGPPSPGTRDTTSWWTLGVSQLWVTSFQIMSCFYSTWSDHVIIDPMHTFLTSTCHSQAAALFWATEAWVQNIPKHRRKVMS